MRFETRNPASGEVISTHETMSPDEISGIAEDCEAAQVGWRGLDVAERVPHFLRLADVLRDRKDAYGRLITTEMGKPITDAVAEVEKCAWTAEVYAANAERWLREERVEADGKEHIVSYEPLGVILSIMPWNFPFWQALRFAIPALLAGNASILKHSNVVPQCALAIEDAFKKAGFPDSTFRTIIADHTTVGELIASDLVRGVSLTGSTEAGRRIGEMAGRHLKKVVLELGGSDPFVVLDDVDVDLAARNAALGRTFNAGQSCIAAKRFIVEERVAEPFIRKLATRLGGLIVGDPMDEETQVGPLVSEDAVGEMEEIVADAVRSGARVMEGGKRLDRRGSYFAPTLLADVTPDMRVAREEVFGPVAPVLVVRDDEEAVQVANTSEFGLGGSVWARDLDRGMRVARRLEAGTVFVNGVVKSDPRMPFGGVKRSGHGRELSKFGMREFVNVKGLNVYDHP